MVFVQTNYSGKTSRNICVISSSTLTSQPLTIELNHYAQLGLKKHSLEKAITTKKKYVIVMGLTPNNETQLSLIQHLKSKAPAINDVIDKK
jgi:DNA polymerase V